MHEPRSIRYRGFTLTHLRGLIREHHGPDVPHGSDYLPAGSGVGS
jgi:hypothetical protein